VAIAEKPRQIDGYEKRQKRD